MNKIYKQIFYEHMEFKVYEGFEIYEQKIFIQSYS